MASWQAGGAPGVIPVDVCMDQGLTNLKVNRDTKEHGALHRPKQPTMTRLLPAQQRQPQANYSEQPQLISSTDQQPQQQHSQQQRYSWYPSTSINSISSSSHSSTTR
jgi:hypothetical protein